MEETLLVPSPNWFLVSNLAVSQDGWIIYGGPSKSICVLEPLENQGRVITGNQTYRAHVAPRSHPERVVSVDISSEFPEKRNFLTGSADGSVKQWCLEKVNSGYRIKTTHSHEAHFLEKEEIAGVGYSTKMIAITVGCFGNVVKWDLSSNVCKTYNKFLSSFKATCMACSPHIPLNVAVGTKQGVIFVLDLEGTGKVIYKVRGQDDEVTNLSWCPQFDLTVKKNLKVVEKKSLATLRMEAIRNEPEPEKENVLEQSGIVKKLPEDSFDESVVEEEDLFDMYKDHEANEFGHKKYEPEDILVKVKEEKSADVDYLAECLKLKQDILKMKNHEEPSIESLVEAMGKTHVDRSDASESVKVEPQASSSQLKQPAETCSVHAHKHLLATIGRFGGVRIWSKSGKLVASCTVSYNTKTPRNKVMSWPSMLWYSPDSLLLVDGKSQLVECNPLQIDSKNKLEWHVVHSLHKRGLYAIVSNAPRIQNTNNPDSDKWIVFTVSQDRNIIAYSMKEKQKLAIHNTCGGFVYNVQPCPYDAGKIAVSVGDGAVRVWQSSTLPEDDTKLYPGKVQTYWQNVQGKVLTVAWHPTKENLLAFGTAESRVGLLDVNGKFEKPARVLYPALNGGVYSLCWGEDMQLYACGGHNFVVYNTVQDEAPKEIEVTVEGQKWSVGAAKWTSRGLLCGSNAGAVAVLEPTTHEVVAVAFIFSKMIHSMEWHPQETSTSNEESPHKNLIAVSSLDKNCNIIILEYKEKEDGGKELVVWKTLSGHKMSVLQLAWNPHRDGLLLSSSQDASVRVWDIVSGTCVSIFGGHSQPTLGVAWSGQPAQAGVVVSGGADCCLRLWDYSRHEPEHYERMRHDTSSKTKKQDKKIKKKEETVTEESDTIAANLETARKPSKKFILPILHKQMNPCTFTALKKMYEKYVLNDSVKQENGESSNEYGVDFIKIFGSINEVNEVLDLESSNLLLQDNSEAWITLSIFRGHIDSMIQFASQRDMLSPYLLSMAPCVSFKYWKDATQLYIAQIDRIVAKGDDDKLSENKFYGGAVYKKVAALLSIHDIKGAVATLTEAKLFKEAYILCRIRYMDSIAEQTLQHWAKDSYTSGNTRLSAICHMALGNLSEAATILAKIDDQEILSLAADLAKITGRNTFADHVEKKAQTTKLGTKSEKTDELLEELPSKIELLLKNVDENNENVGENVLNGGQNSTEVTKSNVTNIDNKMQELGM